MRAGRLFVKKSAGLFLLLFALSACAENPEPAGPRANTPIAPNTAAPRKDDQILANVGTESITRQEIEPVLMNGYGLNVVLKYVELHLVRAEAAKEHLVISKDDIENERKLMLQLIVRAAEDQPGPTTKPSDIHITPEEAEQLLDRSLVQSQTSRAEFENVTLEVQATLRKIVTPSVISQVTDQTVLDQFNAIYGEKAVVHYVVVNNLSDAQTVEQELAQGKTLEDEAKAHNQTIQELKPFGKNDVQTPEVIRDVIFGLKPGQVADPVQFKQVVLVMKLMEFIAPKEAKFEDYKDAVKQQLVDQKTNEAMLALNKKLAHSALQVLVIRDPILKAQWDKRQAANDVTAANAEEIRKQMDAAREAATMPAATEPSTR